MVPDVHDVHKVTKLKVAPLFRDRATEAVHMERFGKALAASSIGTAAMEPPQTHGSTT